MKNEVILPKYILVLGLPFLLFASIVLLLNLPISYSSNGMSLAISIDLLITIPSVYYLLIRKTSIPKTTIVPMMLLGLGIGYLFLPESNHEYLNLFKIWVLPVIELSVISFVVFKVSKALKALNHISNSKQDFFTVLKQTSSTVIPKPLVVPFATEIAVFYYGFLHWKAVNLQSNEYSYHKKSGIQSLLIGFILVVAIEAFALHALIAKWSHLAAWLLTGLSMYSGFQLFGIARSMSKRPIRLLEDQMVLNYGILSEVEIPYSIIASVEYSTKDLEDNSEIKTLSPLSQLDSHNVIIHLKTELILTRLYGFKKTFKSLAFHVDSPHDLISNLELKLPENP